MSGFVALMRKEFTEVARTWKVWVLPGLLVFLAVTGAVSARFTRELMDSLMPVGMNITIPDPTWRDTLVQWNKNMSQIGMIAVLLTCGGMINAEARQGTQVLILTKPVSRWGYVAAKYIAATLFVAVAIAVATAVEYMVSRIFFPDSQLAALAQISGVWMLQAAMLIAVVLIGSATFASPLAASGLGLGAFFLVGLGALWGPTAQWTPAGAAAITGSIAAGDAVETTWPLWTTGLAAGIAATVAGMVFSRREL